MVDTNPARGMPIALQRYWLAGKGALKIRWNIPGDFKRCVRNLRKYFPKDPEGLCNILHTKATGGPPGHGSMEKPLHHSLTAALDECGGYEEACALIAAMPQLGEHLWAGPLAPIGRPTGEPRRARVFQQGALKNRTLPLPLDWREKTGQGHDGAVTVGRILGIHYGPDHAGNDYAWGWGDFLDESIIPEAAKARYLMDAGVTGASIDPGGKVAVAVDPITGIEHMMDFTIGGATLVSIPAFDAMALHSITDDEDYDDQDMVMDLEGTDEGDCGCGPKALVASVNNSGWRGLPLAPREAVFDNDDAVKRIQAWALDQNNQVDAAKLNRAFMWHDPAQPPTMTTSYRLPVGDVINGRLTLIYHAIYAAAALLAGAHGGLPDVSEPDRQELRNVISEIYPEMATAFNDSSIRAPWDRSAQEGVQMSTDTYAAPATEPYGDVKYADPGYRAGTKRYPIDTADHVRAAWAYINVPKNAAFYNAKQLAAIKAKIMAAAKKLGVEISDGDGENPAQAAAPLKPNMPTNYSMTDDGYPLTPPGAWFDDPSLAGARKFTVTPEGHVFGYLAMWNECHRGVSANRECVMAPHSATEYAAYHLGDVVTAEGDTIRAGKIVMDTGHADIRLGYSAAAAHYDNTGSEVAVVRAGEDEFGIWVAGSLVPEATPRMAAKLRRSPLSGDWRRERGNLELTAALAVNAPGFPVYSMDNDDRVALVAAGIPEPEYDEPVTALAIDMTMVASAVEQVLDEREEVNEREQRLRDLREDEEILKERARKRRLSKLFAMDPNAPAPAPVDPNQVQDPAQAGVSDPGQDDAWLAQAQADARYSILEPPPLQQQNPFPNTAPVAPAPPAPAQVAPPVAPAPAPAAPPGAPPTPAA